MDKLRMRVRFDYVGRERNGRLFFGSKSSEEVAEEIRQQQAVLFRNIPIQGILIEEIDMGQEVYSVTDDVTGKSATYAPITISFYADTIEDAVRFCMKEEFRTIETLAPETMEISKADIDRIIIKANLEIINYKGYIQRKIDHWK
ncbi:MAG: hypothetical protein GX581_01800 [Syntrophomonadaceae bacterium]|jgi:dihydroneopterin aldolase|nr:hypothetical protein [Syntrophomonadaceae bacterium]